MKRLGLLLTALFFVSACAGIPKVIQADKLHPGEISQRCNRLYLQGRWQFQHVIEAAFAGERKGVLMGVSTISAERGGKGSVHCILMTIEGLVVFDARYDEEINVLRAIAPFDSENFAEGLFNDIRLIFFRPDGRPSESGTLADGSFICRYRQPHGPVVDAVKISDRQWELRQYGRWPGGNRTVELFYNDPLPLSGYRPPHRLKLTTAGYTGYTLEMDLIDAVPMEEQK